MKDEIILEVLKSNHLQVCEKECWKLSCYKRIIRGDHQNYFLDKRNILRQTKHLQEKIRNFCIKRVMVKAGILPSISVETARKCLPTAGLKLTHIQRKGILTKDDLKLKRAMCNYEI